MATTVYLTSNTVGVNNGMNHLQFKRGDRLTTISSGQLASTMTSIPIATFITKPISGARIEGTVTFDIRGSQTNPSTNATLSIQIARWIPPTQPGLPGSLLPWSQTSITSSTELSTTENTCKGSGSFLNSIDFNHGDAIAIRVVAVPIGTFGTGVVTIVYGTPPGLQNTGNSFITFTQDFEEKNRTVVCI